MTARPVRTGRCVTYRAALSAHRGQVMHRVNAVPAPLGYGERPGNGETVVADRSRLAPAEMSQEELC